MLNFGEEILNLAVRFTKALTSDDEGVCTCRVTDSSYQTRSKSACRADCRVWSRLRMGQHHYNFTLIECILLDVIFGLQIDSLTLLIKSF